MSRGDEHQAERLKAGLTESTAKRITRLLEIEEPDPDEVDPEAIELLVGIGVETLVAERLAAQCP